MHPNIWKNLAMIKFLFTQISPKIILYKTTQKTLKVDLNIVARLKCKQMNGIMKKKYISKRIRKIRDNIICEIYDLFDYYLYLL